MVEFEEGRRWLLDFGLAERCSHCHRRWQTLAQRPFDHASNGPYVIVDIANGAEVGTSDKLLDWEPSQPSRRHRDEPIPERVR